MDEKLATWERLDSARNPEVRWPGVGPTSWAWVWANPNRHSTEYDGQGGTGAALGI